MPPLDVTVIVDVPALTVMTGAKALLEPKLGTETALDPRVRVKGKPRAKRLNPLAVKLLLFVSSPPEFSAQVFTVVLSTNLTEAPKPLQKKLLIVFPALVKFCVTRPAKVGEKELVVMDAVSVTSP